MFCFVFLSRFIFPRLEIALESLGAALASQSLTLVRWVPRGLPRPKLRSLSPPWASYQSERQGVLGGPARPRPAVSWDSGGKAPGRSWETRRGPRRPQSAAARRRFPPPVATVPPPPALKAKVAVSVYVPLLRPRRSLTLSLFFFGGGRGGGYWENTSFSSHVTR